MHWPLESILELDHGERRVWAGQVSAINKRVNGVKEEERVNSWLPDLLQRIPALG